MAAAVWRAAYVGYLQGAEVLLRGLGRRPPYAILRLRLAGDLPEHTDGASLSGLLQRPRSNFLDMLTLLEWAATDPQLRIVLVACDRLRLGWARVQELRRALARLRGAGKQVWVYLEQAGIREYMLASVADRLAITPAGTLDVAGLSTEVTFFAGALQKLGIEPQLIQMGTFKSAAEPFTREEMSAAHREMLESVVGDLYEQVVDAVARDRRLTTDAVAELLGRGPFTANEARAAGLVDAIEYADQLETAAQAVCEEAPVIAAHAYLRRHRRARQAMRVRAGRTAVALVQVGGAIKSGDSVPGVDGTTASGADALRRDLDEIRARRDIKAVVIRISSPGGSGLASDLMWREIDRTRRRKPVVISFGDVAASGGYYAAIAGAPIIAEAGTLTGSIGVLAGKAVLRRLYNRLGINKQLVSRGRHAALYSDYVPLGDEERERLRAQAEFFYRDFVDKVAAGRGLSTAAVEDVAQGRVWTGRQALARRLIDQIGGLGTAIQEAKVLAGLAPDGLVAVERYPRPRRLWRWPMRLRMPLYPAPDAIARAWVQVLRRERVWALLPFHVRFL